MPRRSIEVDEEIWTYLQSRAQPFLDTPNDVLRRELLRPGTTDAGRREAPAPTASTELPSLPLNTPAALKQVLWVIWLVKKHNQSRLEATKLVARHLRVEPQTVMDKYGRQLGTVAGRFNLLLHARDHTALRSLLQEHFPEHTATIVALLQDAADGA